MNNANIDGRQVYLRPLSPSDAENIHEWMCNPEIVRHLRNPASLGTKSPTFWVGFCVQRENEFKFGILEKESRGLIGVIALTSIDRNRRIAKSGTIIGLKDRWGQGHAFEAKMLCLNFAFQTLGLCYVYCCVLPENERCISHLRRCGYVQASEAMERKGIEEPCANGDMMFFVDRANWEIPWHHYSSAIAEPDPDARGVVSNAKSARR
jgi:RimJ/RimL family protein N-acetyltransferase